MANPHVKSPLTEAQQHQAQAHFVDKPAIFSRPWNLIGHAVPGTIVVDFTSEAGIPPLSELGVGALLTLLLFPWIANPQGSPWLQALLSGSSLTALGAGYWLTRTAGNPQSVSLLVGVAVGLFASMPQMPRVTPATHLPRKHFANDPAGRLRRSSPAWAK